MSRSTKSKAIKPTTSPCTKAARSSASAEQRAFFTVGHSTRSFEDFLSLLRDADVQIVADVRTLPRSRANLQFNKDTLRRGLTAAGIATSISRRSAAAGAGSVRFYRS